MPWHGAPRRLRPLGRLLAELGTPIDDTSYALCLYDETTATAALVAELEVPAGGVCMGRPCWRATGEKGFKYRDKQGAAGGLRMLLLRVGAEGKAKLKAKAKGAALVLPDMPLGQDPRVVVQLVASHGPCWQAGYPAPAQANSAAAFKDRSQ